MVVSCLLFPRIFNRNFYQINLMIDTVLVLRIDEEIILEIKLKMCNENILLDYFTGKIILDIHKKWNSVDQFDF